MPNEPAISDPLAIVSAELYRNYVLAGRQDALPALGKLSETAGAILDCNAREPRPVPAGAWRDLFQFTRRKWALCGFGELMSAWEGEEYREWQVERRRQAAKAAAPMEQERPREPEPALDWVDVWGEAWRAGQWVPSFMAAELESKFGKQKIFAISLDNRETAE